MMNFQMSNINNVIYKIIIISLFFFFYACSDKCPEGNEIFYGYKEIVDKNGNLIKINKVDGCLSNGLSISFYSDSNPKKIKEYGNRVNGKQDGIFFNYDEEGNLFQKQMFDQAKLIYTETPNSEYRLKIEDLTLYKVENPEISINIGRYVMNSSGESYKITMIEEGLIVSSKEFFLKLDRELEVKEYSTEKIPND